jgi:hypothetical protein
MEKEEPKIVSIPFEAIHRDCVDIDCGVDYSLSR